VRRASFRGRRLDRAARTGRTRHRGSVGVGLTRLVRVAALLLVSSIRLGSIADDSENASDAGGSAAWRVEDVAGPNGVNPEVGALAFLPDGRLVVAFRLGSVWIRSADGSSWSQFASGLFWPLGIIAESEHEILVAQVPELTRIVDTDHDGSADLFETVSDRWGLSGNYHEFISGPVRDRDGALWVALGCASSGGPLREHIRGSLRTTTGRGEAYGHYSPVPYRGWVLRISPDGTTRPFSSGFRQPNGIVISPSGAILVSDNQGDWVGTSPIHQLSEGSFHGHPASLVWDPDWHRDPNETSIDELRSRRREPALRFVQNEQSGSLGDLRFDTTQGRFGPFAGQLFVTEWTHPRIHRVFLEDIGGELQGATFVFLEAQGLRRGTHRLAFAPDGSLFLGQVSALWGGVGEGIQRVAWTGKVPFDVLEWRLRERGFELRFTRPVRAECVADPSVFGLSRHDLRYQPSYGSPKIDVEVVAVSAVRVSADRIRVEIDVEALATGKIYELRPQGILSEDGEPLATRLAAYTLRRLVSPAGESISEDAAGGKGNDPRETLDPK
jgi:glucose/arabinose dehydrogenase